MALWIEKALAKAIHERQLSEHGGIEGVRGETLLESALARPRQLHAYSDAKADLADLAASLVFGIVRNHPFVDGNKRTAAVSCETFIELNGGKLQADDLALYPQFPALAGGDLSEAEFANWLRQRIEPDPDHRVHEAPGNYRRQTSA